MNLKPVALKGYPTIITPNRIILLLVSLQIFDVILGFNSGVFNIASLNFRYPLLFLSSVLSLVVIGKGIQNFPKMLFLGAVVLLFISFVWTSYGIFENSASFAIADGKGLALYLIFLPITALIYMNSTRFYKYIFNLLYILFILTSLLWTLSLLGLVDISQSMNYFSRFGIDLISARNSSGRVWFSTSILFNLFVLLFVLKARDKEDFSLLIFSLFLLFTSLATGSRSLAIGILPLLLIEPLRRVIYKKTFKFLISSIFVTVVLAATFMLFSNKFVTSSRLISTSATDFTASNSIRSKQLKYLLGEIEASPMVGHGFGYYMSNFIRSPESPFSYELYYLALTMKIGILGMIIFTLAICMVLLSAFNEARKRSKQAAFLVSIYYASVLVQAGFNPFLDTILGPILLLLPVALCADYRGTNFGMNIKRAAS